jgi:hypothetical protein
MSDELEFLKEEAKNALKVTRFWDSSLEGKEVEAVITVFMGTMRLLNQKTNALAVAIEMIGSLKDVRLASFKGVTVEDMLTRINQALICQSFEDYTTMDTTIQ